MKHAQQVIHELSVMKKRPFRVGDPVRFGGGSIHGRYTGTIKQIFKNNKASVSAKVRGVDKMFHPDFDDLHLVTEDLDDDLDEARIKIGDRAEIDMDKVRKTRPKLVPVIQRQSRFVPPATVSKGVLVVDLDDPPGTADVVYTEETDPEKAIGKGLFEVPKAALVKK